jgi:hypothetical protein
MAFWLTIGPVHNWERALERREVWGVRERYQATWDRMRKGDILLFYAMKPIKGIIGYGTIRSKAREADPFWAEEVAEGKALWPLRLHMEKVFCLPRNKWETNKITIQRALQNMKENVAQGLIRQLSHA